MKLFQLKLIKLPDSCAPIYGVFFLQIMSFFYFILKFSKYVTLIVIVIISSLLIH